MRKLLSILLAALAIVSFVAQAPNPSGRFVSEISSFGGLIDFSPVDVPVGSAMDMMNFDIVPTGQETSLRLRRGFSHLGYGLPAGNLQGLFYYNPIAGDDEVVAIADRDVYRYSSSNNTWVIAGAASSLSGTADVVQNSDTVRGNQTLWWELSDRAFTHIALGGTRYLIDKILSDSIIVINAVYASTDGTVVCTLATGQTAIVPTATAVDVFDNEGLIYGEQINDTLIMTEAPAGQKVKYSNVPSSIGQSIQVDSISNVLWRTVDLDGVYAGPFIRVYSPNLGEGAYMFQMQVEIPPATGVRYRNISLVGASSYNYDPLSIYFYCDSATWKVLNRGTNGNGDRIRVHRNVFPSGHAMEGEPMIIDSLVYDTILSGTISGRRITTSNISLVDPHLAGTYASGRICYIDSVSGLGWSGDLIPWPIDTLDYLTVLYKPVGSSIRKVPVWMSTRGGNTAFAVWLQSSSTTIDSSAFDVGDAFRLVRERRYGSFGEADSVMHVAWNWGTVFRWNANRFGYFGRTDSSGLAGPSAVMVTTQFKSDSAAQYVVVGGDDGLPITAGINIGAYVYIHKGGQEIYQITLDEVGLAGEVVSTNSGVSALTQRGVGQWRGTMLFIAANGLYAGAGSDLVNLAEPIKRYWADSVAVSAVDDAALGVYNDRAYVTYTQRGGSKNNRTLIYDFIGKTWTKYDVGSSSFVVLTDEGQGSDTLLMGSPLGSDTARVMLYGRSSTDTGTTYISAYYRTGWLPTDKEFSQWQVKMYGADHYRDANGKLALTLYRNLSTSSAFFTDTISYAGGSWSSAHRYAKPNGPGGLLMLELASAGETDSLVISSLTMELVRRLSRKVYQ